MARYEFEARVILSLFLIFATLLLFEITLRFFQNLESVIYRQSESKEEEVKSRNEFSDFTLLAILVIIYAISKNVKFLSDEINNIMCRVPQLSILRQEKTVADLISDGFNISNENLDAFDGDESVGQNLEDSILDDFENLNSYQDVNDNDNFYSSHYNDSEPASRVIRSTLAWCYTKDKTKNGYFDEPQVTYKSEAYIYITSDN